MRHAEFAHGNFDFHARVVRVAQHFGHAARGLGMQRRLAREGDDGDLPFARAAQAAFFKQHVLPVAAVFRPGQPHAAFAHEAGDERARRAADDGQHPPFGAALAVKLRHGGAHAVAVQHGAHLRGRQVQVRAAIVAQHEAVAVAVALHSAFQFIFHACFVCFHFYAVEFALSLKRPGGGIGRRTSFRY